MMAICFLSLTDYISTRLEAERHAQEITRHVRHEKINLRDLKCERDK